MLWKCSTWPLVAYRAAIGKPYRERGGVMRKLVLSMMVSLDGLVARPGRFGASSWGPPPDDPALKERKLGWMHDVGLHLMGRNTYEEMAEFWPVSDDAY